MVVVVVVVCVCVYGDSVDNIIEKNSSIFSLIQIYRLLPARACRQ